MTWLGKDNEINIDVNDTCYTCMNKRDCPDLEHMNEVVYRKNVSFHQCSGHKKVTYGVEDDA